MIEKQNFSHCFLHHPLTFCSPFYVKAFVEFIQFVLHVWKPEKEREKKAN